MKKWLSILLVLALSLGLCACGGASQPATSADSAGGPEPAADAQEGTETPEPEKVYVTKSVYKLVRMKECAVPDYLLEDLGPVAFSENRVTEYSYDEFGNPAGETVRFQCVQEEYFLEAVENAEWRDDVTYICDDDGNLVSVSMEGDEVKPFLSSSGWTTTATGTFENGRLTKIERVADDNGMTVEVVTLEYHPNGAISRETTTNPVMESAWEIFTFESPLVSIREFNEDGRCTLLHKEDINLDTDELRMKEYTWQYDANGNPVSMAYQEGTAANTPLDNPEITYKYSAEMQYDAQNRMVSSSLLVNEDPNPVDFVYHYDSDGQLSGYEVKTGEQVQKAEYEYGENGLLSVNHFTNNGSARDIVYNWEEDEYGWLEGTNSDGSQGVFQYSDSMTVYPEMKDDRGNVTEESRYVLMPSLVSLFPIYVDYETAYDYDKVSIKVEADPEAMAAAEAGSVEDYYPELNDSYGGYPVPEPNGTLRLTGLSRIPTSSETLIVNTDFAFNDDGSLAGANRCFDAAASYAWMKQFYGWDESRCAVEADELGRLFRITFNPGTETEYSFEYTYPDDSVTPTSFQRRSVMSDGSVYEEDIVIDDYKARDEIRKTQSELNPAAEFEYDEDGMVVKAIYSDRFDTDGNPFTREYEYTYETDDKGFLKSFYSLGTISFNEDGYLESYTLMPAVNAYYEYHYSPAA